MSYVDPGSADDIPDAGEVYSDGSDFIASGAVLCVQRMRPTCIYALGTPALSPAGTALRTDLDQSHLGIIPPSRFITAKQFAPAEDDDL